MCYSGAAFRPRTPPFFRSQTRKLSATNQQRSSWLYIKHLMDMFPSFWIRKPITFGKYPIFHHTQGFSANMLFQDLHACAKFLVSWIYLSLFLFKFKIGPSLNLFCLMSSMFIIMQIIIRVIKTTCFENTILMAEHEGKLP